MYAGALELDVLLGDVHSLKQKRSVVRPVVAELRRRFEVAAAEAGHLDLHRRALLGVSVVAADAGHVVDVLDRLRAPRRGPPRAGTALGAAPVDRPGGLGPGTHNPPVDPQDTR